MDLSLPTLPVRTATIPSLRAFEGAQRQGELIKDVKKMVEAEINWKAQLPGFASLVGSLTLLILFQTYIAPESIFAHKQILQIYAAVTLFTYTSELYTDVHKAELRGKRACNVYGAERVLRESNRQKGVK